MHAHTTEKYAISSLSSGSIKLSSSCSCLNICSTSIPSHEETRLPLGVWSNGIPPGSLLGFRSLIIVTINTPSRFKLYHIISTATHNNHIYKFLFNYHLHAGYARQHFYGFCKHPKRETHTVPSTSTLIVLMRSKASFSLPTYRYNRQEKVF